MITENLYSDGNVGDGVIVVNGANANGVQDGVFATANGGWAQNDNWEFTMENTALTTSRFTKVITMVCNLRYFFNGALGLGDVFGFDVHDGIGWTTLETFNAGNAPQGIDPGDYVESYDLSGILDTVGKLNAAKFRWIKTDAIGAYVGTVCLDSLRIRIEIAEKRLVGANLMLGGLVDNEMFVT